MREGFFAFLLGFVLVIAQTTSFFFVVPSAYKPDLLLVGVVWAGLRLPFMTGLATSFVLGVVTDLLSGSPPGLFVLIYCLTFASCGYLEATLTIGGGMSRAPIIFIAALLAGTLVVVLRWFKGPVGFGWNSAVWIFTKSLITAGAGVIAWMLMDRAYAGYTRLVGGR